MKNKSTQKRLDGGKKLIALTAQLERDIKSYCREKRIESESELIRQAIIHYIDREYGEDTFKLSALKDIKENLLQVKDMLSILYSYLHMMHHNILAYHPEIIDELKETAYSNAETRLDKFFASFRERLRDDPSFFERLLHGYVSGELDE